MSKQATAAHSDSLQELAQRWFQSLTRRYLDRLQDNFYRRASQSTEASERTQLMAQHKNICRGAEDALQAFQDSMRRSLRSARPYELSNHGQLDKLLTTWQKHPEFVPDSPFHSMLRAISPMSVMAGFQQLAKPLRIAPQHRDQALSLFNVLLIRELPQLYNALQSRLEALQTNQLANWIAHTQKQLDDSELSTQQRALGELRLKRLQQRAVSTEVKAPPQSTVTDAQLIESVAAIFYKDAGSQRPRLSSAILASLNTLQTLSCTIALKERQPFLSPLHPVRLCCQQIIAACGQLHRASTETQQQFETHLRSVVRQLAAGEACSSQFSHYRCAIDSCCEPLLNNARLDDRRKRRSEVGQERVSQLRKEVHKLIDQKTRDSQLPGSISNLLYGPLSTILVYHWLRHGGNSVPIQRNLKLIDHILWYIRPQPDWSELRRAKAMATNIESELMDGLKRIHYDEVAAQAIIDELHHLRLVASGVAEISKGDY